MAFDILLIAAFVKFIEIFSFSWQYKDNKDILVFALCFAMYIFVKT